ncbi:sodium-coupled monocarboxylate transporter 1-like [Penaeus japonicus]|uniref:sodium-coupled monocarboxylate transporter 1-like n=1 Tax=Penaeus japonicus TaxID=27405 RepID=UPI001C7159F9|nr:sodium-coupled monocarboxylate transporter 1-like [Penaeus japonicus]
MDSEAEVIPAKFTVVDYVVFSLMLVVSVGIGVYTSLRGKGASSTQDFLLGGRDMNMASVALSLTGGVISAIAILGLATEVYLYGTQIVTNIFGCALGVLLVRNVILPVVYPLKLVSIYQYIEVRFRSQPLRKYASTCQVLSSCFYLGICLYAPSLALSSVTNLPTWASVIIMGSICTFYITVGGVKAVVYTDVIQTLLMFFGVLAVVILCCGDVGGIAKVWELAAQGDRLEFFNLDTSPYTRHTLWSTMVIGIFMVFSFLGVAQPPYQRFASAPTLAHAQRLPLFFLLGMVLLWGVFYTSGLVAYAIYKDCDPLTSGKIEKPDQIIPYMVTDKLSHLTGIAGLFVAAVYGGVLSSLSSQGNAIACVVWEDFLKERAFFRNFSDRRATNVIKILSSITGLIAIGVGLLAGKLGTINYVLSLISAAIRGPLCGLFFVGLCAPWANTKGATAGLSVSLVFNIWMVIGRYFVSGKKPVRLPLSVEGCPEETVAGILLNATVSAITNTTSISETMPIAGPPQVTKNTIYDISYCYNGCIGILLNYIVSSIVSFCTGPYLPGQIEEHLVYAPCFRLYQSVYLLLGGKKPLDDKPEGTEEAMGMLPTQQ